MVQAAEHGHVMAQDILSSDARMQLGSKISPADREKYRVAAKAQRPSSWMSVDSVHTSVRFWRCTYCGTRTSEVSINVFRNLSPSRNQCLSMPFQPKNVSNFRLFFVCFSVWPWNIELRRLFLTVWKVLSNNGIAKSQINRITMTPASTFAIAMLGKRMYSVATHLREP